jgi:predicted hotdog family 3-hydroxylacyl-ACP dehydratase
MHLKREWIVGHIPHQGGMCLLDEVCHWDESAIHCRTRTHLDASNPLRRDGHLAAVCGIEYAAQAMAVHGALLAGASTKAGYLASVRGVRLRIDHLDECAGALDVHARRMSGDAGTVMYEFALGDPEAALVSGRAVVVLDAALFTPRQPPPAGVIRMG